MKLLVGSEIGSYAFDKVNKKVTLSGLNTLTIDKILLITNVTRGTIIFLPTQPTKIGTISGNAITLTYNTNLAAWSNTDALEIFIDYPEGSPVVVDKTPVIST